MRRMNLQLDLDPARNVLRPRPHGAADVPSAAVFIRDADSAQADGLVPSADVDVGRLVVAHGLRGRRVGTPSRGDPPVLDQAIASAPSPVGPTWFDTAADAGLTLVIPEGACVRGDCRAPNVWVRGEVRGRVVATDGMLVVSHGARVHGGVEGAGPVVLAGQVRSCRGGPAVVARGRLDIAASAHVVGTVFHNVLALYDGARVEGPLRCLRVWRGGRG